MSTFQDGVVLYKSAATLVESISFYQNEKKYEKSTILCNTNGANLLYVHSKGMVHTDLKPKIWFGN